MNAVTLIAEMEARHVHLYTDNGQLGVKAPPGVLTKEDLNGLRLYKPAILEALAGRDEAPAPAGGGPPSEPAPPSFDTGRFLLAHPWRRPAEIAQWPIDLRERWGRRSNELAEQNWKWPLDEMIAFLELTDPEQAQAMLEAGPEAAAHAE